MLKLIVFIFLFYTSLVKAVNWDGLTDQFDKTLEPGRELKSILFAADMDAYKKLKEVFEQQKINQVGLIKNQIIIVADTSKMPKLIAKMFAMPKMKQLSYSILLDREGQKTASWERQAGSITLLQQTPSGWSLHKYLKNSDELKSWLNTSFIVPEAQGSP